MPKKVTNPVRVTGIGSAVSGSNPAPKLLEVFPITSVEEGRKAVAMGIIDRDGFEDMFHIPY